MKNKSAWVIYSCCLVFVILAFQERERHRDMVGTKMTCRSMCVCVCGPAAAADGTREGRGEAWTLSPSHNHTPTLAAVSSLGWGP